MSVRFVIGRAGSGKTRHCFDAIVAAARQDPLGPPIYWILPRQGTFTAERELACLSGLDAFCRPRVVSFEEFGRDVFDDCGASSIPQVTALGRRMILGHLLRQNRTKLRFFSQVARQPGLAAELDATFAELERSGKTPDDLAILIDELSQSNATDIELAPLLDKLHDTRLLFAAYSDYLGQERLDQHTRSTQLQQLLGQCAFLHHATIYVDSFVDFTEHERRVLIGAALAGARIEICLMFDPRSRMLIDPRPIPDEMSLFRRTEETYRKLYFAFSEAGVAIDEPIRLESIHRFQSPALLAIEQSLFRDSAPPSSDAAGVEFTQSASPRGEVDAAARRIIGLLRGGLRLRDIGILVRNLDRYHGVIEASLTEHRIAFFVDRRRPATHHPLLQFVRSLFQISRNDWPHDAVMTLLRSGLSGVSLFDADGLENYVVSHRIRGAEGWESPRPWGADRRLASAIPAAPSPEAQHAQSLRQALLQKLLPLIHILRPDDALPVRKIASELFETLDRFGIPQILAGWISDAAGAGHLEKSAEHEQVWANLIALFDEMVDLLGDEQMTPGEFFDVLEAGLDGFDLALTPPTLDQVLVGQVDRTRNPALKAVFVLGLNEGEFPQPPGDASILTDRDRGQLRHRRIDLGPPLQQRLLDERFLGYIALTRASAMVFPSRALADEEGLPTEPSPFWRRLTALFPGAVSSTTPRDAESSPAQIATPRQLVASLMRWVRDSDDPAADASPWPALYQWLSLASNESDIGKLRDRAWPALSYVNSASLSPGIVAQLFPGSLDATVAQLESFAACPFQHFARYVLGLRRRDPLDRGVEDLGRFYHDLLEKALREVLQRRADGDLKATLEPVLERYVNQAAAQIERDEGPESARNRYLLERTRMTLREIALSQREILKRGLFRPRHVGVTFGPDALLPPLRITTPRGAEAVLRGKIDRVDRIEGSADVSVIDYRTGPATLARGRIVHGLELRLLAQLLVLQNAGEQLGGSLDPAGAFYLQLVRRISDVKHPDDGPDLSDPAWRLDPKPRGVFDRRCLGALDRGLTSGRSAVVAAFIAKDGSLGHRNSTDVVETEDFRALLDQTRAKLGELADGVRGGKIEATPYRLGEKSPCAQCDFRGVCRFDQAINRYNRLDSAAPAAGEGADA